MTAAATAFTVEAFSKGCLLTSAIASGSADIQRAIANIRKVVDARLRARIEDVIVAAVLPFDAYVASRALLWPSREARRHSRVTAIRAHRY